MIPFNTIDNTRNDAFQPNSQNFILVDKLNLCLPQNLQNHCLYA